jgi:hypothetical protein
MGACQRFNLSPFVQDRNVFNYEIKYLKINATQRLLFLHSVK